MAAQFAAMGGLMKQFIQKISAFTASAVIAVCSTASGAVIGAETAENQTYTVHFDLSEDGISIIPDKNGDIAEITDITKNGSGTIFIPDAELEKEGYIFSGWTEDDVKGYEIGDVFKVTDHDVTLHPVWVDENDTNFHVITYRVEWDGQIDTDAEKYVPPVKKQAGRFVKISSYSFPRDGYKQRGWTDGTNEFAGDEYMIVHDEDITLRPNLKKLYNLRYSVGDADRISGITELVFEIAEGERTNLQSTDRFSRNGFKVSGWHCENNGLDYKAIAEFIMPSEDVLITPIWSPTLYTINFKPTNNSSDFIKVKGYTDTAIVAPECTYVKDGYTFNGWTRNDIVIQPGEEYVIEGAAPGMGISFTAVWTEGDSEQTTSTTSAETTTTTTVTSATTTAETTTSASSTETSTTASASSTTTTAASTTSTTVSSETTTTTAKTISYGDANCDGDIDMSDAVLIMQALANPDKYDVNGTSETHITAEGRLNADVDKQSEGLTVQDALTIQEYLLGIVKTFPVTADNK